MTFSKRPTAPRNGPGRRPSPSPPDPADRLAQNRRLLSAYAGSGDAGRRLAMRNALVAANLPLVRSIAARRRHATDLPFEDLLQVGSLGLIRAVEAFDPARTASLSSFAVPYILGAIRHELRDRHPMVRIPRQLWELRQQASSLQERRRRLGEEPLDETALPAALGCAAEPLQEALRLARVMGIRSLDAPQGQGRAEGEAGGTLLEQLADPASLQPQEGTRADGEEGQAGEPRAELRWLRRALAELDPVDRRLLEGRLQVGCTWVELGAELGMPPRQAQRRCTAIQDRLKQAAAAWRASGQAA
jgi:RNA polymerase sigma-B factor